MKYVIGNWKANKNLVETGLWLTTFLNFDFSRIQNRVTLILCPPYPLIPLVKEKLSGLPFVKIGCQNISFYNPGAYTGEVPARSIVGLVDYCIVGHSERRQYFSENHDYLAVKVKHLQSVNIEPIFCVRAVTDPYPPSIKFLAYEPVFAIGSGQSDSLDNIIKVKHQLKLPDQCSFIYGGSVTDQNAINFLECQEIDGVLPGGASLDPKVLYEILNDCP